MEHTMTASETAKDTLVKGMDIIALLTSDPERQIAFYRDVLGMTPTDIDEKGRGAEFSLEDGSTFGVWKPDEGPAAGATIMFAVEDITRALATFRARGATLSDAEETPVCFMSFGADPDGNGFIVHQRKPEAA
jgi:predicted enzyme related to lactoylglutathione lyase